MASHNSEGQICVNQAYLGAIWESGGNPSVLPYTTDESELEEFCDFFDGFVFCGGEDIDPTHYGQEKHPETKSCCPQRDAFELAIFPIAFRTGKPILAICRGEQLINVALGGTLHQHVEGHIQKTPREVTEHPIKVLEGSLLHKIIGETDIYANTLHHQCVCDLADGLVCNAVSSDGYIEAYHHANHRFCLAVQWHPECFYEKAESSSKIFKAFISACK